MQGQPQPGRKDHVPQNEHPLVLGVDGELPPPEEGGEDVLLPEPLLEHVLGGVGAQAVAPLPDVGQKVLQAAEPGHKTSPGPVYRHRPRGEGGLELRRAL